MGQRAKTTSSSMISKTFRPHPTICQQKAYSFRMGKRAENWYSSLLSFNMFKLPEGEYTVVTEFFPPSTEQVTVSVVSSSLISANNQPSCFPNTADPSFACRSGM